MISFWLANKSLHINCIGIFFYVVAFLALMDIYGVYFALMNFAEGSVQNVRDSNSYNLHPHTKRKYIRSSFMASHFIFVNELKSGSYGYFSCMLA